MYVTHNLSTLYLVLLCVTAMVMDNFSTTPKGQLLYSLPSHVFSITSTPLYLFKNFLFNTEGEKILKNDLSVTALVFL